MTPYIERVLLANRLADEAELLRKSDAACFHVDQHVDLPRDREERDILEATCVAGMQLLAHWKRDREVLLKSGLWISEPVLVIDDEWLEQLDEAPPHVCITLSKLESAFDPPRFVDHGGDDFDHFPLRGLIEKEIGRTRVVRVESNPNPPFEKVGFWLVM